MLIILTITQTDGSCLVSREQFHTIIKQLTDWKVCVGFLFIVRISFLKEVMFSRFFSNFFQFAGFLMPFVWNYLVELLTERQNLSGARNSK